MAETVNAMERYVYERCSEHIPMQGSSSSSAAKESGLQRNVPYPMGDRRKLLNDSLHYVLYISCHERSENIAEHWKISTQRVYYILSYF